MRYFRTRARSRRFLLVCAATAVVVLAGTAAIAYAAYPNNSVTTYTGCLTPGGTIVNVAANPTNPMTSCAKGSSLVHLSGGTITQISAGTGLTTAGSGGTGGSGFINNGFATLGLLPGFTLPQNCTSGQVAKSSGSNTWACANDQNTTYSNGTGLDLSNTNVFSINSNYQLPQNGCSSGQFVASDGSGGWNCQSQTTYDGSNFASSGQDCPTGQFATGIDGSGNLKCAPPTLGDLQGSPCTFNGHPSTLHVSTDNTTGAVSMTCNPVFHVSATVSAGELNIVNLYDDSNTARSNSCYGPGFGQSPGVTSCSTLMAAGDKFRIFLTSGDPNGTGGGSPFTYTCPGEATQEADPNPADVSGTAYRGQCPVATLEGTATADYPVTVNFGS